MDHVLRDLTNTHTHTAVVQQPAIAQAQAALIHASDDYLHYMSEIEVCHSSP